METQMKESGFGIAALVLGIIGLLTSCFIVGILPAALGLIFAIVALASKNRKHGTAVGGLVCSIIAIVIFIFVIAVVALGSGADDDGAQKVETMERSNTPDESNVSEDQNDTANLEATESLPVEQADDFSDVETVYELEAGYYTAGIDIPSGRCNVVAVSGTGILQSSNMFNGGVNEMFGIDDATDLYTESFNGLKLPEGTYTIEAIEGAGSLFSSDIFNGGVNEMFGIDKGMGYYNEKINNVTLEDGIELTISGGLKVRLIPAE